MSDLWTKAGVAARSARLLLESGDTDGATNRAYYAMFDAARAALSTVRPSLALSKRHGTIVRRFDKHLVAERGFDCALGMEFFQRQRNARWIADYDVARVEESSARLAICDMDTFLAAIGPLVSAAAHGKKRRARTVRKRARAGCRDNANA